MSNDVTDDTVGLAGAVVMLDTDISLGLSRVDIFSMYQTSENRSELL